MGEKEYIDNLKKQIEELQKVAPSPILEERLTFTKKYQMLVADFWATGTVFGL